MSAISVSVILLISLLAVAVIYLVQQQKDIATIRQGLRSLVREEPLPLGLHFSFPEFTHLWRYVLAIVAHREVALEQEQRLQNLVENTSMITRSITGTKRTASGVCDLIGQLLGSDLAATAVVLRDVTTGTLSLSAIRGISAQRIEQALLMHFDALCSGDSTNTNWGYRLLNSKDPLGAPAHGLGLTLTVPLVSSDTTHGGLWLGFKRGARPLSEDRQRLILAICQHAAASLDAAQEIKVETQNTRNERDLLLGISHDLRAPGNTALYALRNLLSRDRGELSEDQTECLQLIEQGLQDQLELLGDVLDYAKHHQGELTVKRSAVTLRSIIEPLLASYRCMALSSNLALSCDAIPDMAIVVNPVHAKRIVANLLSNAVKYTPQGGIHISFVVEPTAVEIQVLDTGIGVPAAQRSKLGTQFSQFSADSLSGTGLGLAVTKSLLEANGGSFSYRPRPSGGSIFSARFERQQEETLNPIDFENDATSKNGSSHAIKTILVVDDEPAVCRTNIRYLRNRAQTIVSAHSLNDAIDIAQKLQPPLIVTDYHLGDGTADDLISNVRAKFPQTNFIVITGNASPTIATQSNVHFLYKPVDRDVLCAAVDALR